MKIPLWAIRLKVGMGLIILATGSATMAGPASDMVRGMFLVFVGAFIVATSVEVSR